MSALRLFLCGDVMTGRGIDQILPNPCPPQLHEDYVQSALDYVRLAEAASGPIARPVSDDYIWGGALDMFRRLRPDVRIVNLETSITRREDFLPKGINYRMSPENAACLAQAGIDCCVLANNHMLDWRRAGLLDTLTSLERQGIKATGAGRTLAEAEAPAVLATAKGARVLVFAFGCPSSGVPPGWAATPSGPGVNYLSELSEAQALSIAERIEGLRQPGDVIVVSFHWGPNWGYATDGQRAFAQALIDRSGISVIHGHSSHHAKGMEVHRERLILYGCGDFLNDYEGIRGLEDYRGDLALMYFVDVAPEDGRLLGVTMVPLQIRKLQLGLPSSQDVAWLWRTLDRHCRRFGTSVEMTGEGHLALAWPQARSGPQS